MIDDRNRLSQRAKRIPLSEKDEDFPLWIDQAKKVADSFVRHIRGADHWREKEISRKVS
jgi:hypothetical protein